MEHRLALQEKLLEEEKHRTQQDNMITAMAADYRSVYHVDLDADDAVCYRGDPDDPTQHGEGVHFPYLEAFRGYAHRVVTEPYREGFLRFIEPETIREGLKTEKILAYRYLAVRNGVEYYEMIRAAGVHAGDDEDGRHLRAIGLGVTIIDAEMRKTMAQQQALSDALQAAEEASRAKTVFLSNMSHEIRTPMNAIIGLDNIALRDPDLPPRTREHLEKIGASANHLLGLINDILDMSRIESGRMVLKNEEFSFREFLNQINIIINGQCQDKGLSYDCNIVGDVNDYYFGDDMKLKQVMINILGNSVKFTNTPGSVTLTVEQIEQADGMCTLRFIMKDTGIGMDKKYIPKIFESFSQEDATTTNKYGGSGLGMAITKNFVEMMNGEIQVESEKGVGSVFTVTVKLKQSDRSAKNEQDKELPEGLRAAVVDDDEIACENIRLVLKSIGIESDVFLSGKDAEMKMREAYGSGKAYDVLLTDYKMPEMDGLELTRLIHTFDNRDTVVIMLTSYSWDIIEDEAKMDGVDGILAKPLFADVLYSEIYKILSAKKGLNEESGQIAPAGSVEEVLAGRRVLMAEDVEQNAEILADLLELEDIGSERARNGKEAVQMFSDSEEGYYDAILMDVRMPEMDGLTATRTIRALERPDAKMIPIIAMTANVFDEDIERSMKAGMNAHISKPIETEKMYETMARLISEAESRKKQILFKGSV